MMWLEEEISIVKQVFFHYQEGSIVDHLAYKPYTLVGPPALGLVLDPLAVIFLDNRPYITVEEKYYKRTAIAAQTQAWVPYTLLFRYIIYLSIFWLFV